MKNIATKGIKSVLILDDDFSTKYTYDLIKRYADPDCLESLGDEHSPARMELFELYKSQHMNVSNLTEIIESFNIPIIVDNLPSYYKEEIIDAVNDHKHDLQKKLDVIIQSLIALGVKKDDIYYFDSIERARECKINPDLFILDLFLEEGKPEFSLEYLRELVVASNDNSQFILMSYSTSDLSSYFRKLHVDNEICSAQLKIIEKPECDSPEQKIRWEQALFQLSLEKELIHVQKNMQLKWSALVQNASLKFTQKIWSLDNFGINKLRMAAAADDISLGDYLITAMYKALLAEVENDGDADNETRLLEEKLQEVDNRGLLKPSWELYDSYSELNSFIADLTSHRLDSLKQINVVSGDDEYDYAQFVSNLSYGAILKFAGKNGYFLHLTQPCDYIHVKKNDSYNNNLILFPGFIHGQFSAHNGGNKKHLSSFVYLNGKVSNIEWNLRLIETKSMQSLFDERCDISIVGKLRTEEAQAISHMFGSSMSRVATPRFPWFTNVDCFHVYKKTDAIYNFLDTKGVYNSLNEISNITNGSNAVKYTCHVSKRREKKNESYVISVDTKSIPLVINCLENDKINYDCHFDFEDEFVIGEDGYFTSEKLNMTVLFLKEFKMIFSKKSSTLSDKFKDREEHHFLVLNGK